MPSDTSEATTASIIIFAAISTVIVLIILLLVIVIICGIKKKTKERQTIAFTSNTDVNMFASPAYGTHQVFIEPGLYHLYEPIEEYCEEETTTLQDTASPVDHAAINGNEDDNGSHSEISDEYVQAADKEHMPANNNDEAR